MLKKWHTILKSRVLVVIFFVASDLLSLKSCIFSLNYTLFNMSAINFQNCVTLRQLLTLSRGTSSPKRREESKRAAAQVRKRQSAFAREYFAFARAIQNECPRWWKVWVWVAQEKRSNDRDPGDEGTRGAQWNTYNDDESEWVCVRVWMWVCVDFNRAKISRLDVSNVFLARSLFEKS